MKWGLENASVKFGSHLALDRVSLAAEPSTISVVVGGDGAGKSTLVRALVGLVQLCQGDAYGPRSGRSGMSRPRPASMSISP